MSPAWFEFGKTASLSARSALWHQAAGPRYQRIGLRCRQSGPEANCYLTAVIMVAADEAGRIGEKS